MNNEQQPQAASADKDGPPPGKPNSQAAHLAPGASFNPGALPPHIQEQLRRQMQAQNLARHQQGMQPGIRPPTMPMIGAPGGFGMISGMPNSVPMSAIVPPGIVPPPRPLIQVATGPPSSSGQALPVQPMQQQPRKCPIPATRIAALSQVKSFFPGIDESAFMHSLSQFLACVSIPLRKPPVVQGRPISLLLLFTTVTTYGGFVRVSETRRWPAVAASLSLNPTNMDSLATLHSIYGTLLYPYEQFMIHKTPAEAIQWPPAVIKAYEMNPAGPMGSSAFVPTTPQLNQQPTGNRLATAMSRIVPNGPSASSSAPVALPVSTSPDAPMQGVLDAIGLSQWKSVKALGDPFLILHKGRYSYKDICLYLESNIPYLERFGMNQVQVLLLDPSCPTPDPSSIKRLTKLIIGLGSKSTHQSKLSIWALSRKSHFDHLDLCEEQRDLSLPELATNTLRALHSRSDAKAAFEASLSVDMISQLYESALYSASYELRKNSLVILSELSPSTLSRSSSSLEFVRSCMVTFGELIPLMLISTHRSFLSWESTPADAETLKKTIINMIPGSTNVFKMIPSLSFVHLEILYKLLLQFSTLDEAQRKKQASFREAVAQLIDPLVQLFEMSVQPLAKLCRLIGVLVEDEEFRRGPEYIKWIQKILHSSGFGLPDGGYLELLLLCLRSALLQCLSSDQLSLISGRRLVDAFVSGAESIRSMWSGSEVDIAVKFERQIHINNPPGSNGSARATKSVSTVTTDKSPLIWQQANFAAVSSTSHPYQVYLQLIRILDGISGYVPLRGHADLILGWFCGEGLGARLSREILMTPDLQERHARLLHAALDDTL